MGTQMKLYEREKKVLKLEEECLRSLIFQYQSALNALKVEELTLANRLGQSLDRARKSQANTPTASMNPRSPSNLPILITKETSKKKKRRKMSINSKVFGAFLGYILNMKLVVISIV
ncbi:hypothetical protein Avbf_01153 [Armadillidium vulgare]|nr:hypothetical protein Avbf_01153 [Armadillidium vulgare]